MQTEEIKSHVEKYFKASGWTEEPVQSDQPLNQIFSGNYATVGILIADVVDTILLKWRKCQDYIDTLKDAGRILPAQDSYLLLILPRFDTDFDELREVLEDTHVCRKICLEIGDRTIEEALMELPFFTSTDKSESSMSEVALALNDESVYTLSTTVLDELAGSSAEIVLSRLLRGEYDE